MNVERAGETGRDRPRTGSGAALEGTQRAVGDRTRAPADGDDAGLDEFLDAERLQDAQERLELVRAAGGLDRDRVGGDVDDLGAEQLNRLENVRAGLDVRPDLDEQQLALD